VKEMGQFVWRLVVDTMTRFQNNRCPTLAAGVAYYLLISTSPVFFVAIAVAGSILGRQQAEQALLGRVDSVLGSTAAETVQSLVRDPRLFSGGITASVVALVVLVYGSTRAFSGLQSALDVIWEKPPSVSVRLGIFEFIRARLLALVLALATGGLLLAGLALETLSSTLSGLLASYLTEAPTLGVFGYRVAMVLLRACCLAVVYRLLPWRAVSWRVAWPAGLLASVLLSLGHSLLGGYIAHGGLRSAYGAAGSVIALLFSFYFLAYVVLLGAQVGKVHDDLRRRGTGTSTPR
jgi:membrane protein